MWFHFYQTKFENNIFSVNQVWLLDPFYTLMMPRKEKTNFFFELAWSALNVFLGWWLLLSKELQWKHSLPVGAMVSWVLLLHSKVLLCSNRCFNSSILNLQSKPCFFPFNSFYLFVHIHRSGLFIIIKTDALCAEIHLDIMSWCLCQECLMETYFNKLFCIEQFRSSSVFMSFCVWMRGCWYIIMYDKLFVLWQQLAW